MLDDLVQTIETLKQRIKDHRDHIQNYESRTRVALIDPILRALGWDVSDPNVVEIEPRVQNGWADYALLGSNGKPVFFVEAKKLADKDPHLVQTISYILGEAIDGKSNVRYCAWTNGDAWEIYDTTGKNRVMTTSIATEDVAKCALKFLSLWRRSMTDGVFDTAVEPVVEPNPRQVEPEPLPPAPDPSPLGSEWTPLSGDFDITGRPAPLAIRFPDNQESYVIPRNWYIIPVQTALWLYRSGLLTQENCRIVRRPGGRSTRYILSPDGKHSDGSSFRTPAVVPNTGIVMEANHSGEEHIDHTRRLLEHFDQDPSQVFLKFQ